VNVYTAYGQSVETDLGFDALPFSDSAADSIHITVDRVSTISLDPGNPARPCSAQGRTLHIVAYPRYVTVQVDLLYDFKLWLADRRIECSVLEEISDNQLRYWLIHQIVPLFFAFEWID